MSDAGDVAPVVVSVTNGDEGHGGDDGQTVPVRKRSTTRSIERGVASPKLTPDANPLIRRATSLDLDDYFVSWLNAKRPTITLHVECTDTFALI